MPGVFPHDSFEWLGRILDRADREHAELVIHLGDFTHGPTKAREYVDWYNGFKIPTYHVIGNHDDDGNTHQETLECYRMKCGYYSFDVNGFRFVILDPNYYYYDGVYTHYSSSNYYKFGEYRDYVPPEQVEWLKDTLDSSPFPCVLFSHESFERESDGVKNQDLVRKVIDNANEKHPGRVMMCINGHYHRDNLRIINNVAYFELNSASFEWVPQKHNLYPEELCSSYRLAGNTVMYNDPVNAIITLTDDGGIKVDGMTSSLFMGITREMTGNDKFDAHGRPTTATVSSFNIKLL